jgi:hypothetical protein
MQIIQISSALHHWQQQITARAEENSKRTATARRHRKVQKAVSDCVQRNADIMHPMVEVVNFPRGDCKIL